MAINQPAQQPDLLTSLRNLRRDRAAGVSAPIAAAQTQVAGPAAGSLADLQRSAAALRGESTQDTGVGARVSNVQETMERAAAKEQLDQVAQQAALGEQQAAQAEERLLTGVQQAERENELQYISMAERAANERAKLLESARQAKAEGRLARAGAAVNQAEFLRRLSNDKYIQELQQTGQLMRLDSKQGFEKALADEVFGEKLGILQDRLTWDELMNANDIAFKEKLAAIDLESALEMSELGIKTAATQTGITGVSTLASGGAQAYEKYESNEQAKEKAEYDVWADEQEAKTGKKPSFATYMKQKK